MAKRTPKDKPAIKEKSTRQPEPNPNDSNMALPAKVQASIGWWEIEPAIKDAIKKKYPLSAFDITSFLIRKSGEMEAKVAYIDVEHPVTVDASTLETAIELHLRAVHGIEKLNIISYAATDASNKYITVKAETVPEKAKHIKANQKPAKEEGDGS